MTLALHGKSKQRQWLLVAVAFWAVVVGSIAAVAFTQRGAEAASVPATFTAGNPSCEALGYDNGFKPDPDAGQDDPTGTYVIPGFGTIVVTENGANTGIDWTSTFGISAVIVKGGPNANVYYYDPASTGDTNLVTPTNPNNNSPYGLSHVEFCWDGEPEPPQASVTVSKTANGSYDQRYDWTIDKSATPTDIDLFNGESQDVDYDVVVTKSGPFLQNIEVTGTITIANDGPGDISVTGVSDVLGDGTTAVVTCLQPFPFTVAEDASVNCTYTASPSDIDAATNTATVTYRDQSLEVGDEDLTTDGGAPITWVLDTTVGDSICVDDSVNGAAATELGCTSVSETFEYSETFTCDADEGTISNTATIRGTEQSSTANVSVDCYELSVSKTANPTYTRTFTWDIVKSVVPEVINIFDGDTHDASYTVEVTKSAPVDSDWAVTGTITITNPAPKAATLTEVIDEISGDIDATVVCPSLTVPANGTLDCTYSADLPDAEDRTNTATATQQLYDYDSAGVATPAGTDDHEGTADIVFGDPTTVVNDEVSVSDASPAAEVALGTTNVSTKFEYSRTFACGANEGTHPNTATIDQTGQSDDASVTVNCYNLTIVKTAATSLTRTWTWDIDKTGDQDELLLQPGQNFLVNYLVTVTANALDSAWAANGTITVTNDTPIDAVINSVADLISPDIAATVTCPAVESFPYTLGPGEDLVCSYTADLPDGEDRTNTATAVQQNYAYDYLGVGVANGTTNHTHTVNVLFDDDTTVSEVDECIVVDDSLAGDLGTVCASELPKTFSYSKSVGTNGRKCAIFDHINVAMFTTNDTSTTGSDDHVIEVTVYCDDTAWAANGTSPGSLRYNTRGNWATYVEGENKTVNIYAGQTNFAGTATLTANNGTVTITINLAGDYIFADGDSLKVQVYSTPPSGNPAPGKFSYKAACSGTTCQITVPNSNYYGIHLDVLSLPD